jgi:hypothetical protein
MHGHVDRGRVAVKGLADHEHGLAMGIAARAKEGDVRRERHVAGDLLPREMKVVDAEPHVLAAAAESVGVGGDVIHGGAGMEHGPHVLVVSEDSVRQGLGLGKNHGRREDDESGDAELDGRGKTGG